MVPKKEDVQILKVLPESKGVRWVEYWCTVFASTWQVVVWHNGV